MIDFINTWKNIWDHSPLVSQKLPLTEKTPGEYAPYPYPIKKVKIDSTIDIAYSDVGSPDASILLFVHGLATGIPVWKKNIQKLKSKYRCIALDLPGHGYSTKGNFPYNMSFYADAVLSFIKALNLTDVTLVGHSMGGQIAVLAALKQPELIRALVLASPSGVEPFTVWERQMLIHVTTGMVASGNIFTHNRLNQLLGFNENQKQAAELVSQLAYFKNEAFDFSLMMLRSTEGMLLEGVNHVLYKITQPCLVLAGRNDQVSPYPLFHGKAYADVVSLESTKIPRGQFGIFSKAGHFLQYQSPDLFNKEVKTFLSAKVN